MSPTLEAETYLIDLMDDDGEPYAGRLTGIRLDDANEFEDVAMFLLRDGRNLIYYPSEFRCDDITDYVSEKLAADERFKDSGLEPSEARIINL